MNDVILTFVEPKVNFRLPGGSGRWVIPVCGRDGVGPETGIPSCNRGVLGRKPEVPVATAGFPEFRVLSVRIDAGDSGESETVVSGLRAGINRYRVCQFRSVGRATGSDENECSSDGNDGVVAGGRMVGMRPWCGCPRDWTKLVQKKQLKEKIGSIDSNLKLLIMVVS